MDNKAIAQAVLSKARTVTVLDRLDDLINAFASAGISVTPNAETVTSAGDPKCFEKLASSLGSTLPTAMILTKRVLAKHGVNI